MGWISSVDGAPWMALRDGPRVYVQWGTAPENSNYDDSCRNLVDKMAEYREMEDAMRSTLLTAQKMATSMVAEAEQKRTALITSASSAAKARQTELEREIAYQERRLEEVRRGVDQKLEQERKRLAAGQQALRGFIQDVRTVCNDQLAMLELLPELPVEEPAPPQVPAPAAAPPAAPVQEAAVAASATVSPEDEAAAAVEQNIKEVVSMISREKGQEAASGGAGEDPFAEDDTPAGEDGVELASTRVLNRVREDAHLPQPGAGHRRAHLRHLPAAGGGAHQRRGDHRAHRGHRAPLCHPALFDPGGPGGPEK